MKIRKLVTGSRGAALHCLRGENDRTTTVGTWWELCSGIHCRSLGPPNSSFAPATHNRDDLGCQLSPFKMTQSTKDTILVITAGTPAAYAEKEAAPNLQLETIDNLPLAEP